MKKAVFVFLTIVLALVLSFNTFADDSVYSSTKTFRHDNNKSVVMKSVFSVEKSIGFREWKVDGIGAITDIDSNDYNQIFVLTDKSTVLELDDSFRLIKTYIICDNQGSPINFDGAKGIYSSSRNEFYIADTNNAKVLYCKDGIVEKEILSPESDLIPKDFIFKPTKVVKDSKNYLYVLSDGCYYGALLYEPDGDFCGFYGANSVEKDLLSSLQNIWDMLTQNDIKRSKSVKALPFQFSDISIDKNDFIYTSTGKTSGTAVSQIRMLSPGGSNILSGSEGTNFGESDLLIRKSVPLKQNFSNVVSDDSGFIFALDSSYGIIYVYDNECNMLCGFGGGRGLGTQKGTFITPVSIEISDGRIIVADAVGNLTIFNKTKFGESYLKAQKLTLEADYENAKPLWQEVLKHDSSNQLALSGYAKVLYNLKDYKSAMKYAKNASDSETYSLSLSMMENNYITKNFTMICFFALLLLSLTIFFILFLKKKKIVLIKNHKVRLIFACIVHPFDSFNDIKFKHNGSVSAAMVLTVLYFLSSMLFTIVCDFRFSSFDVNTYNSLYQILQTIGLITLWSLANWAVCTLMQGNGKLKEVFIVSSYSILPLIIYNVIMTPLSYIISSPDSFLISGLYTISLILTGVILSIGLMTIHEFSFPKVLGTAVITVLLMILIIFVLFMIGILISQFVGFVSEFSIEAFSV